MLTPFVRNQGYTSDAVLALNYAIAMGAEISSNSWGGAQNRFRCTCT